MANNKKARNLGNITSFLYDVRWNVRKKVDEANTAIATARLINEALKRKNVPLNKIIPQSKKPEMLMALDKTITKLDKAQQKAWASPRG